MLKKKYSGAGSGAFGYKLNIFDTEIKKPETQNQESGFQSMLFKDTAAGANYHSPELATPLSIKTGWRLTP